MNLYQTEKICFKCRKKYFARGKNQIYCGGKKDKEGCSYQVKIEKECKRNKENYWRRIMLPKLEIREKTYIYRGEIKYLIQRIK